MKQKSIILRCVGKRNIRSGSYTLEAAIFLPLFIVGILTLGFTIRMISTSENITVTATDEARQAATFAYNIPLAPLFPYKLRTRLLEENPATDAVQVNGFRYLYQSLENDGLISFRLNYWVGTGLPMGFIDGKDMAQQFRCRGFICRTEQGTPISFDEMETNSGTDLVWVFPEEGERYHKKDCPFISSYPVRVILNQEIRDKYMPCEKCDSNRAEIGTQVYCFQKYGQSYHLYSCPTVDKYVISMEKEQAEERGYTPCLKCGGSQ
jgi:hypothetical protein